MSSRVYVCLRFIICLFVCVVFLISLTPSVEGGSRKARGFVDEEDK